MLNKRFILTLVCASLIGVTLNAKDNDDYRYDRDYNGKKEKHEKKEKYDSYDNYERDAKQKDLPPGLQKKINNGGQLPPGWEKKLSKGQIADESFLSNGRRLNSNLYPNVRDTEIYQVENKIFRISRDTREILDILK